MSRPKDILDDLDARHPHAYKLAVRLALVVRIDPAYLRAIRLHFVPEADADDELALWTSALVRSKGYDGFVFTHAVNDLLRAKLEKDRELWQKVWDMTEKLHRGEPPSLVAEERIRYAAMRVPYEGPGRLDEEIRKVLAWAGQGEADKLNRFGAYLLPTLPDVAARSAEAWRLQWTVQDYPGFRTGLSGIPDEQVFFTDFAAGLRGLPTRPLYVRFDGDQVVLGEPSQASNAIPIPDLANQFVHLSYMVEDAGMGEQLGKFELGNLPLHQHTKAVRLKSDMDLKVAVYSDKVDLRTMLGEVYELISERFLLIQKIQKYLRYRGEYWGAIDGKVASLKAFEFLFGDEFDGSFSLLRSFVNQLGANGNPSIRPQVQIMSTFDSQRVDEVIDVLRPLFEYYNAVWDLMGSEDLERWVKFSPSQDPLLASANLIIILLDRMAIPEPLFAKFMKLFPKGPQHLVSVLVENHSPKERWSPEMNVIPSTKTSLMQLDQEEKEFVLQYQFGRVLNHISIQNNKIHPQIQKLLDDMVFVRGGSFMMGSEEGENAAADEKPKHQVHLSDFHIGKYPVTQAQWEAVMGENPSRFKGCPDCPVEQVSWNDCQTFLVKFNAMTGLRFSLPTEAQWEFAAHGGQRGKSQNYRYAGSNNLDMVAWHNGNSKGKTHPVKGKDPNALGLYDMSGNVWEWCRDLYDDMQYQNRANRIPHDPIVTRNSNTFVLRGGAWSNDQHDCRINFRGSNRASVRFDDIGLRVVRNWPLL